MRWLALLLLLGCGTEPTWHWASPQCESVVEGACIRFIPEADVVFALAEARRVFGPFRIDGWNIEGVPQVIDCGYVQADGCNRGSIEKIIEVRMLPLRCDVWVLVHEFGHIILSGDPYHGHPLWAVWDREKALYCA
jgi:hypothetical protein